jgi:hypothetical protein
VQRLDVARVRRIVPQRAPQLGHDAIEHARRDVAMAPDGIEQAFALDRLARVRQQLQEHRVRLGFHADHRVAATHADGRARTSTSSNL